VSQLWKRLVTATADRFRPLRSHGKTEGVQHSDRRCQRAEGVVELVAGAFFLGAYAGGRWTQLISDLVLRRLFAVTFVVIAVRMWFEI